MPPTPAEIVLSTAAGIAEALQVLADEPRIPAAHRATWRQQVDQTKALYTPERVHAWDRVTQLATMALLDRADATLCRAFSLISRLPAIPTLAEVQAMVNRLSPSDRAAFVHGIVAGVSAAGRKAQRLRAELRLQDLVAFLDVHEQRGLPLPTRTARDWERIRKRLLEWLPDDRRVLYLIRALPDGTTLDTAPPAALKYASALTLQRQFRTFGAERERFFANVVFIGADAPGNWKALCENSSRERERLTTQDNARDDMIANDVTPVACQLFSRAEAEEARFEALKREISKPASQRTQEAADKRWPFGPELRRFHIELKNDLKRDFAHFPVWVNAHSEEEAKARYMEIMNITSIGSAGDGKANPRIVVLGVMGGDDVEVITPPSPREPGVREERLPAGVQAWSPE